MIHERACEMDHFCVRNFEFLFSTKWRFNFESLIYRVSISRIFLYFFFLLIRNLLASFYINPSMNLRLWLVEVSYTDSIIELPLKGLITFIFEKKKKIFFSPRVTKKKQITFYNPCEDGGIAFYRMEINESFNFYYYYSPFQWVYLIIYTTSLRVYLSYLYHILVILSTAHYFFTRVLGY